MLNGDAFREEYIYVSIMSSEAHSKYPLENHRARLVNAFTYKHTPSTEASQDWTKLSRPVLIGER